MTRRSRTDSGLRASGGISMRPAMIVVGLAALILVVFVTIGIVSTQSPAAVKHSKHRGRGPGRLAARRAGGAVALARSPAAASHRTTSSTPSTSRSGRSGSPTRTTPRGRASTTPRSPSAPTSSQAALIAFYAADMKSQGWQIVDQGPARNNPGALEVLGKLAGSDGYYWEMGATVDATTFPAGGPAARDDPFHRAALPGPRPRLAAPSRRGRSGGGQFDPAPTTARPLHPRAAGPAGGAGSASR